MMVAYNKDLQNQKEPKDWGGAIMEATPEATGFALSRMIAFSAASGFILLAFSGAITEAKEQNKQQEAITQEHQAPANEVMAHMFKKTY